MRAQNCEVPSLTTRARDVTRLSTGYLPPSMNFHGHTPKNTEETHPQRHWLQLSQAIAIDFIRGISLNQEC